MAASRSQAIFRSLLVARAARSKSATTTRRLSSVVQKKSSVAEYPQFARRYATATLRQTEDEMFCFQCEQTKNRSGCVQVGVCGKTPEVAKLQDLLVYAVKGMAVYAHKLLEMGEPVPSETVDLMTDGLFSTVTNVNFDADRFPPKIFDCFDARDKLKMQYEQLCVKTQAKGQHFSTGAATFRLPQGRHTSIEDLETAAEEVGVTSGLKVFGASVRGVRELITYGVKGSAAYYSHANHLGQRDAAVEHKLITALAFLESADEARQHDLGENLGMALAVGEANFKVMELLDTAHRLTFGSPSPSNVRITPTEGKCMLVSGHDMGDLMEILKYTDGKGINVYTHGEMLPAHSYPELRKFKHLAGHFGGGWQMQQYELPLFPGPAIFTSNCIVEPRRAYAERVYTTNSVGFPGCPHVDVKDETSFQRVVDQALSETGFTAHEAAVTEKTITIGFGHETILGVADKVLSAASTGALKHIFLVGGCDGSENRRSYFTELVDNTPEDTLVLTLGCAKYRFNRLRDFGTLGDSGIPRLLDMGQCNDAYGAIRVALALSDALKTDVNSLPLSLCLSWFEQKAVAVLLTLLHLGIRNIRVGPKMPAFITEEVYDVLHDKFNLLAIDLRRKRDPAQDIQMMMTEQRQAAATAGATA